MYNSTLAGGSPNPQGLYNHGPMLVHHNGTFICAWYNGPQREYVENRVVFATSTDAVVWTDPQELFPAVNVHGEENEPFPVVSGRLYAAASDSAWGNKHDSGLQGALLVRRMDPLGPIFWVARQRPDPAITNSTAYPMWTEMDPETRGDM